MGDLIRSAGCAAFSTAACASSPSASTAATAAARRARGQEAVAGVDLAGSGGSPAARNAPRWWMRVLTGRSPSCAAENTSLGHPKRNR